MARRALRRESARQRCARSRSQHRPGDDDGDENLEEPQEFMPHHAITVPREASLGSVEEGEPVTTIMLRHIPCRYTQGSLLRELDQLGFKGRYDFFYLPMDMHNKTSVGYAFINFLDAPTAMEFTLMMQNYRFQRHPSEKIPEASPAHLQGLRRNVTHFASRVVLRARDSKYRPIVLQQGFKRDFGELLAEFTAEKCSTVQQLEGSTKWLNPAAQDFVPGAAAFKSHVPCSTSTTVPRTPGNPPTADLKDTAGQLNPLAKEFVPSAPPGLAMPVAVTALAASASQLVAAQDGAEEAAALAPPAAAAKPLLVEARRSLEQAVASLLRKQHEDHPPEVQETLPLTEAQELPLKEATAEPPAAEPQRQKPQSLCLPAQEVPAEPAPELAPEVAEGNGECSWVQEAFNDLVKDMLPTTDIIGSWSADSFFDVIKDEPLWWNEGSWVADTFFKLVGSATPPLRHIIQGRSEANIFSMPTNGGWIAEAFGALVSGTGTPMSAWRKPKVAEPKQSEAGGLEQPLGWVAETLLALAAGGSKWQAGSGTPRNLGDAVQRLRSMGGWAWVAFA